MIPKLLSFIFVISLAFGIQNPNQVKDVPFDVNEVINRVSPHFPTTSPQTQIPSLPNSEFLIDTSIVYTRTSGYQSTSTVSFDGTNYLVIWQDGRNGMGYDLYGARVTPDGTVLDLNGIPISTAAHHQLYPSATFGESNYLVVWEDYRNHDTIPDIYGARVNQQGIVLDSSGFPISTANGKQCQPDVAFDGTDYLVVWRDERSGRSNIYGTRLNQAGIVLDPNGIVISAVARGSSNPSVAFDGLNYLVVWDDDRTLFNSYIYGTRVSQQGTVLDSSAIPISTVSYARKASVAFDGSNYLVVWEDWRGEHSDIYGARVNQEGNVLEPTGIPICTAPLWEWEPSIAFDRSNYLVVWTDSRNGGWWNIYGSRVDTLGRVLDTTGIAIRTGTSDSYIPDVASDGINYLVVWKAWPRNQTSSTYGARVTHEGTVLDSGILISKAANSQWNPSIASDGSNYLVVWEEQRDSSFDIYGSLVDQNGMIQGQSGFPISIATNEQRHPSVAFDGNNYLVVWQDKRSGYYKIYGARVTPSGQVLDQDGILFYPVPNIDPTNQIAPSVAFDGDNYLVVWGDVRKNQASHIYGTRVTPSGTVLDISGFPISTAPSLQRSPSVVFDGTNYLVVWQDERNGNYDDIYGARVSPGGQVLDSSGISISTAENYQESPSIAFDGINYLVAWQDYRNGSLNPDIYGARVSQAGAVLDSNGFAISTAINYQQQPSVTFDGTDYIVVWEDHRSGLDWDIYGARVSQLGAVIDTFPVSAHYKDQINPSLAHGGGNQILLTYSGWVDSINSHPVDTMRIWGKFYPFIGIGEENSKVKMQSAKLLEVYPNPAKSFLAIRLPLTADRQNLKIFDVSGKLVKVMDNVTSPQSHKQEVRISLKGINPGIYFLRLGKDTKKFLVVK